MAGSGLLEREIEKRCEQGTAQPAVSAEEQEHRRLMSQNMQNLLRTDEETRYDRYTPQSNSSVKSYEYDAQEFRSEHVPAYQLRDFTSEYHPPVVPAAPGAPSAAQRIADYVPVTVGMQDIRRFGDMPSSSQRVVDYAPVSAPEAPAPAAPAPAAHTEPKLFENLLYRNGELLDTGAAPEAPAAPEYIAAPVYSPSYMPSEYRSDLSEENEDALPTRRTMDTIHRTEDLEDNKTTFFSALSTKTKLVLAAVTAVIAILLAVVCINTAILNSLDSALAQEQENLGQITSTYDEIRDEIGYLTSDEYIEEWAPQHGLTPPASVR